MARTRPHIKVHISVADHRKTSAVWADLAMRGMLVELWRKAGEKYAGRTADRVSLKPTDRMDIAATTNQAEADQAVTALCSALRYELRTYPNRWDVRIRKFSKKQGWRDEESQQLSEQKVQRTSASESDSESDTNTNAETKTEREKTRAPSAPRPRRSPSAPFPGSMSDTDWSKLALRHHVNEAALRDIAAGWAGEKDRGYTADGWYNAIDRSLRDRWSWTQSLFARPGQSTGEIESPAQAKARRTKEAGAKAYEMIQARKNQLGLMEIEGGTR